MGEVVVKYFYISSVIAGGNFWDGLRQGVITAGLNEALHSVVSKAMEPPKSGGGMISPIEDGIVSDEYGVPRRGKTHDGIDITKKGGSRGSKIRSSNDGTVTNLVKNLDGRAGGVRVSITDEQGYIHSYNHMEPGSNEHLKLNESVTKGSFIGKVGGSAFWNINGVSPHLHYMIFNPSGMKINPSSYNNSLELLPRK